MPMANVCGNHIGELLRRSLHYSCLADHPTPRPLELGTTGTCAIGASLFRFEGVAIDAGLGRRRPRALGPPASRCR